MVKRTLYGGHARSSATHARARMILYVPPHTAPSTRLPSMSTRGFSSAVCAGVTEATSKPGEPKLTASLISSAKSAARGIESAENRRSHVGLLRARAG